MNHVPASRVRDAIFKTRISRGSSATHADELVDTLVETSLIGVDAHGVRLLPTSLREVEGGRADPRPRFRVIGEMPAAGLVCTVDALGVVAANATIRDVMDRASHSGTKYMTSGPTLKELVMKGVS